MKVEYGGLKIKRKAVLGLVIAIGLLLSTGSGAVPNIFSKQIDSNTALAAENVVEVTAGHLEFEAPDVIPYGWTTFRLNNESDMTHFAVLERLPEGIGVEDHQEEVALVSRKGWIC